MRRLCRDDVRSGMVMLHNLTCYLRAMLPQVHHSPTTLAQETDLVAAYLGILKVRMGARLRYLVEIPGGSGVGLANTRDRLAALYGDAGLLTLESNTPSGVRATIRIPFAAGVAPGPG